MNYRLLISYDGTRYRGWQRLGNSDMTIQGKLESVLSQMAGAPIEVIGSGRTDAGVHAKGQVANFHCTTDLSCDQIKTYLRQYLPQDIGIISVEPAQERFHSRYNATQKTYQYRVWNDDMPCVFERKFVWQCFDLLDVDAMSQAAHKFLGEHDFLAFCSNKHFKKSSLRTIHQFTVERCGPEIVFTITGDGFLYNMVRIMVGTLLDIGRGCRSAEDIDIIFQTKTRENAGMTVPASGLCLMEVLYR